MTEIETLDADGYVDAIRALAELLVDAVEGGAAVNFLRGVTLEQASSWWTERIALVEDGTITPFVIRAPGTDRQVTDLLGCCLLVRSRNQNSPHRAEIAKVLVRRSVRRRGLGRALMDGAEALARNEGRWLLLLDTQAGTPADAFYRSLGWHDLGTLPDHAYGVDGVLAPTTFFWKDLRGT
ncbi:MAG TPA: GNAT family N-acetyltransferase [Candidatus Limnocylindrales bacterium]|jgi:GNAT superfamily N-acetyltransferase